MDVDKLQVVISAKIDPLKKGIDDATKGLQKLEQTTSQSNQKMEQAFNKSIGSISKMKVAIGAAATAAVAGFSKFTKGLIDLSNDLLTLSSQTGLTTDRIQELQFAAEMSGASADKLSRSIISVSRAVESGDPVLAQLGITATDTAEAFEQGIRALSQMEEGTAKAAFGNQLLGRSYQDLKPMIDQGVVGLQELSAQAHASGAVIQNDTIVRLDELRQRFVVLGMSLRNAFLPIVEFVIPVLETLVGWLTLAAQWTNALLSMFFKIEKKSAQTTKKINKGFGSIQDPFKTSAGNLDKANKKAKELQRTLLGIDVIHNVGSAGDADTSLGGGGGGGSIGGAAVPDFNLGDIETGSQALGDFQARIEKMNKTVEKAVENFKKWLPLIAGIAAGFLSFKALDGLWSALGGSFTPFTGVLKVLNPLMRALMGPLESLGILFYGLGDSLLGIVGLGNGTADALFAMNVGIGAVAIAIAAVVGAWVDLWNNNERFKTSVIAAWNSIGDTISLFYNTVMKPIAKLIADSLLFMYNAGIKPLWKGWVNFVDGATMLILSFWNLLKPLVDAFIKVFGTVFVKILEVLAGVFSVTFSVVAQVVGVAFDIIGDTLHFFANLLNKTAAVVADFVANWKEYFQIAANFLSTVFQVTVKAVIDVILFYFNYWRDVTRAVISTIIEVFQHLGVFLKEVFAVVFSGVFDAAGVLFSGFGRHISIVIESMTGVFKGIITFIKGVFTGDWAAAWDGVRKIFTSMWNGLTGVVQNVWHTIIGMFKAGGSIFKGIANAIAKVFKGIVNTMIRGINEVIAAPFRALNNAFEKFRQISIMGAKPFNWLPHIGIPTIPQFATGGFPEDGLFFANSNELVGKFTNGKTAVANNAQIVEGVSAGVAKAVQQVLFAQGGTGFNNPINLVVQIGTKTIAKEFIDSVDEYTMRTGYTFKTV